MNKNYNMPNRIWRPGTTLFGSKRDAILDAARKVLNENLRLIQWGKLKEAINRLNYGDNGSGWLFEHINPMDYKYMTNGLYLNSRLPWEIWAGPDGEYRRGFRPVISNELTFTDTEPLYG